MALHVLLVDDYFPGLILGESVLARLSARVVSARDGRECIAVFRMQKFDIVFMDHLMPNMSGVEATTEIRRIEAALGWSRTPIIALTACAFPSEIEEFLQAGADDVLLKPYRVEELGTMLEKWAPGR